MVSESTMKDERATSSESTMLGERANESEKNHVT